MDKYYEKMDKYYEKMEKYYEKIIDALYGSYIEAFYFADTGEDGQPDNDAELAPETKTKIKADIIKFYSESKLILESIPAVTTWESVGHNFYLTRQGHGSGFWDSPEIWGESQAEQLTIISESFGNVDYYQGDDGLIY